MNLYGYAAGDPINNSDPFGLCPDPDDPECSQRGAVFTASFAAAGGIGVVAVNFQVGVAMNSRGGLMLFGQAGPSVGAGLAVGGQIGVQGGSLNDLLSPTGEGGGGSAMAALGARPSVAISGNGVTIGARGGFGAFGHLSNGGVASNAVSIPKMISNAKAAVKQFVGEGIAAMQCASGLCPR